MHVGKERDKAVLYTYDIHPRFKEKLYPVKLQGLDPHKVYTVKEINLMPETVSELPEEGKTFSGDYLMKVGLDAFTATREQSYY